jgi:hypothetical protein
MPFKASILLVCVAFFVSFSPPEKSSEPRVSRIFAQMYDSIQNIHTLRQDVHAVERVENKFSINRSQIKIQTHPRKIYFINPTKKIEILYDSETATHKAFVKPNVFPYLTMQLDPSGNLMRKNQHYSINELGYDFIGKSIALTISKDKDGLQNFILKGKVIKNGYSCYLIEYENKNYGYLDYQVKEHETATSIALKLCVNDYLLRYHNNLLNDFGYVKKGTVLHVPNLYCQKAILFIDEHLMLPVSLSLFDDKGLFESYEYTNIRINQPIKAIEFTKEFSAYNF